MIDFSKAIERLNNYKGSEKKKTLIYEGKQYLVKFPDPIREKNKNISYINNAFSEYIGSNIFKMVGVETQNTVLGTYTYNGKEKIVCGCEDFVNDNNKLYEFENLALSVNPEKKIQMELSDIIETIRELENMKINLNDNIEEKFWEMFIVDYLIGNTDRHNGNWGIIVNLKNNEAKFSPIYDCGSALNPMLEDIQIENLSETEFKNLVVNCYSCIKEDGKKINYISYLKSCKNNDCNKAILKVFPNIDLTKINNFIDDIDCMSLTRKDFYNRLINYRYDELKAIYNRLIKQ